MPGSGCFLFVRCWGGFQPHFPCDQFNHLPEHEVSRALTEYKASFVAKHKGQIHREQRAIESAIRARRKMSSCPPGRPRLGSIYSPKELAAIRREERKRQAKRLAERTRQQAISKVGGWPTDQEGWSPSPRLWLAWADDETTARRAAAILQERMTRTEFNEWLGLNLRFGVLPVSGMRPAEADTVSSVLRLSPPPALTDQEKQFEILREVFRKEADAVLRMLQGDGASANDSSRSAAASPAAGVQLPPMGSVVGDPADAPHGGNGYTMSDITEATILSGDTVSDYAKKAGVPRPDRGGRNHRFTPDQTKAILQAMRLSSTRKTREKAEAAMLILGLS